MPLACKQLFFVSFQFNIDCLVCAQVWVIWISKEIWCYLGIFILTLATAFAATGYGVMVGTLATTEHQAAIMGSLSILLLSALGGIWVPSYVMPEVMRNISAWSPLNWSLEGFYKLFLRGGGVADILADALKLFAFFLATMAISSIANRKKRTV